MHCNNNKKSFQILTKERYHHLTTEQKKTVNRKNTMYRYGEYVINTTFMLQTVYRRNASGYRVPTILMTKIPHDFFGALIKIVLNVHTKIFCQLTSSQLLSGTAYSCTVLWCTLKNNTEFPTVIYMCNITFRYFSKFGECSSQGILISLIR